MDMRHRGFKILLGIRHPNTIELRRSADISWDILDMAQGPLPPPLRGNDFRNFPMKHPKARLTGDLRKRLTAVFWDMDKAPVSYSTTTKELWDKISAILCKLECCLYPRQIIGYGSEGSLKILDEAPGAQLWEQNTVLRLVRKRELRCSYSYCDDVFQEKDAGPKEDKAELLITSDPDFTFTMASLKKKKLHSDISPTQRRRRF
ncbi:hypothetical protein HID58_050709 [Brassica napus]|uniref:(rape) hypothetical protein n=1 Tax=Brassica napus TaxID=3708 RepID=A0A816I632_BRANA|nr:uncharacterized protein LOC125584090 [Brassica napus]KAH0888280.1 hypothetical protein HID58_050709 [Brassica napus]CAF1697526.1 unnamed protein product [Brassica napus]